MKIGKSQRSRERAISPKSGKPGLSVKHSAFLDALQEKQMELGEIEVVVAQIDEYASQLRQSPTFDNLLKYKKTVRQFLKGLVEQAYFVSERVFYDRMGNRRLFQLVDQIDQELEELTRTFMANQASSIELARRLDEIRGMLLDLYS